jgi:hypothetical protein
MCNDCGYHMEVELSLAQADVPAPMCPACNERTQQDFKPPGIVGTSARSKAEKITENIIANDYHVGDINRSPSRAHLHYKDQAPPISTASSWQASREALEGAIAAGKQIRQKYGSGLDILQSNLKSGAEPDLIEISKKRAIKIW